MHLQPSIISARNQRYESIHQGGDLDVCIVGAGISGASLYAELCRRGYRVGLIDQGDFAAGTSQASGMLLWGGLLYLKNLDFGTVIRLCSARRKLLAENPQQISPMDFHLRFGQGSAWQRASLWVGLQAYWLMGGGDLNRPRFHQQDGIRSIVYQEAMLHHSDSRFVIERITASASPDCVAMNHCLLQSATRDLQTRTWRLDLKDGLQGTERSIRAKVFVNAAGVWTDEVNRISHLDSPYKHALSKGVYLAFPRSSTDAAAHVYAMHGLSDVLTHVPWGPVSMWGCTETRAIDLHEGFSPSRADVEFLLAQAKHTLRGSHRAENVISIRCGIRPLVVPQNFNRDVYPLTLSRKHQIVVHRDAMALSLYGGKFTSSMETARHAADALSAWVLPHRTPSHLRHGSAEIPMESHLGQTCVSPQWARDQEGCATLDDYLRRRTNLAQWTPRMGLGQHHEHRDSLRKIAENFTAQKTDAMLMLQAYETKVAVEYDPLLRL